MSASNFAGMDIEVGEDKVPVGVALSKVSSLADALTPTKLYNPAEIYKLAGDFGFREEAQFSTGRGGEWKVFQRMGYKIPNFPEGETTLDSMLGIYEKKKHGEQFTLDVLSVSKQNEISEGQFRKDLETMTRHYIERTVAINITHGLENGIGAIANLALALLTGTPLLPDDLSEWHFRKRISALDKYFAGSQSIITLINERSYALEVQVARELYAVLYKEHFEVVGHYITHITPDKFLQLVWPQIPYPLKEMKAEEIKDGIVEGKALSKMVEVAHALRNFFEVQDKSWRDER